MAKGFCYLYLLVLYPVVDSEACMSVKLDGFGVYIDACFENIELLNMSCLMCFSTRFWDARVSSPDVLRSGISGLTLPALLGICSNLPCMRWCIRLVGVVFKAKDFNREKPYLSLEEDDARTRW